MEHWLSIVLNLECTRNVLYIATSFLALQDTHTYSFLDYDDWFAETLIISIGQIKLNVHFKLLGWHMELWVNWDLKLIEICATQSRYKKLYLAFMSKWLK